MSVDFTVKSNIKATLDELDDAIEVALEACGIKAEGYAKLELENSPRRVDTGLLRNSITHAVSGKAPAIKTYHASGGSSRDSKGNRKSASSKTAGSVKMGFYSGTLPNESEKSVYIGSNVSYAEYVHEGTVRMAPNRFLKNALANHVDEYRRILESYLSN